MADWLTEKVRRALEVCPVEWREDDLILRDRSWGLRFKRGQTFDDGVVLLETETFDGNYVHEGACHGFRAQALIEKHWREECERRGIRLFDYGTHCCWEQEGTDLYGADDTWLACLADAILATQEKEVPNGEVH